ncbi:hypothetical protein [Ruminococcus sp.]|uniref:hypothetical protein n=1 Tax=Ruminococcus sp. TaxID=41978 RepID=UPI0025FDDEFB|nr:hypothetical protein [Ruminococcus sp.]
MPDTPFAGECHTAAVSGGSSGIAAKAKSNSGKLSGNAGTAHGLYGFGASTAGLETQKIRISEQVQGYVRENSEIVQDQEKYEKRYQALVGQYEPLQKQETALQEQRAERLAKREQIQDFQRALSGQNGMLLEFDTQLWLAAVEKAVVHRDGKIVFVLKDGTELVQKI